MSMNQTSMTILAENIEYDDIMSSSHLPDNLAFQIDKYVVSKYDLDKSVNILDEFIMNVLQDKIGALVKSCDWYVVK